MAEKEYIEREVLLEFLQNTYDIPLDQWMARNYWSKVVEIKQKFISCIEKIPAADVVEVVHARWINPKNGNATCSYCRFRQRGVYDDDNEQNFCGSCGAKMDGWKHETD